MTNKAGLDYDIYENPNLCSRDLGWTNFVVQQFSVRNSYATDWFELDQNMLVLSQAGRVTLECKGGPARSLNIESGRATVYTAPAHMPMRYVVTQVPRDVVFVRFDPRFIAQISQRTSNYDLHRFPLTPTYLDETSSHLALLLVDELKNHGAHGQLYSQSIATALAAYLTGSFPVEDKRTGSIYEHGLSSHKLKQTVEDINSRLGEDLSLADMAQKVDLSIFHFCRTFKQSMGLSPHQYLLERRIDKAKKLLRTTDQPILEIAFTVGYTNQSQFSQVFRKVVGMSPKQFRED